jgi:hypothetical protein
MPYAPTKMEVTGLQYNTITTKKKPSKYMETVVISALLLL